MKKSFILMRDLLGTVEIMTDEEAGKLLKAIINHVDGNEADLPRELVFAFRPIQNQLDRDMKKYADYVEKQKLNGAKGGRPKKTKANPKNPSLLPETQANPKNLVTVTDTVTDSDSDKEKRRKFKPPTHEELKSYLLEKSLSIDADQFIDFYESKGWYVGKNKMKCWKAAVRTWAKRGNHNEKTGNRSRSDTAAAVGSLFEKEANAAARRLSEGPDSEVQSYIPAKVGRTIQNH